MIEQSQGRRRKCGGVLILFVLAAGLFAVRMPAAAAPAAGDALAEQTKPPTAQAPTPAAKAKQAAAQYGDIYLVSERWSRDGDRIIADGNVELHYKNIILYADHLEADSRTKDVLALGRVTLHIGEEIKKPKAGPGQTAKPVVVPPPAAVFNEDGTLASPPPPAPPTRLSPQSGWSSTWTRPRAGWKKRSG